MKSIYLRNIKLLNFKGVRDAEIFFGVDSDSNSTNICGKNGLGKTTIFDAFTWLLFGKNSEDDKQFSIKTLDENGQVIPRIPHEVWAELIVDGKCIELRKTYNEKWQKKRGTATEEFTGHEEERFYNDVPCTLKEWSQKINDICEEGVFKLITNPFAFTSMKPNAQREVLFRMAGNPTNEEIAGGNTDFADLLDQLQNKSLEEYRKEINAKKRRIEVELDAIPERINERKRDIDRETDFPTFERDIKNLKAELQDVEKATMSEADKNALVEGHKIELQKALSDAELKRIEEEQRLAKFFYADYFKANERANEIKVAMKGIEADLNATSNEIKIAEQCIEAKTQEKEKLTADWYAVQKETVDEKNFVCPTCKRIFNEVEIEQIKEAFNLEKANKLADINRKGHQLKDEIEKLNAEIEKRKEHIRDLEIKANNLLGELNGLPTKPDYSKIAESPSIKDLNAKIEVIKAEIEREVAPAIDTELANRKKDLEAKIEYCTKVLALKDVNESNLKRISELEEQLANGNEALANLEGIEFNIQQFGKRRINMIEERINGMFRNVKFKMFNQQINGGETETCEAMVEGVPFADLNHAGKINAGLDIINAICKYEGIHAPIFIDNAEAVNCLLTTDSQMIKLVVTEDKELTLK